MVIVVGVFSLNGPPYAEAMRLEAAATLAGPEVSAQQLIAAYQDNELAADRLYKDQWVTITGTVTQIAKAAQGEPYVSLGTDRSIVPVLCVLTPEGARVVEQWRPGQRGRVYGQVQGFPLTNTMVIVQHCDVKE
jgi:tRNA_anti-like